MRHLEISKKQLQVEKKSLLNIFFLDIKLIQRVNIFQCISNVLFQCAKYRGCREKKKNRLAIIYAFRATLVSENTL